MSKPSKCPKCLGINISITSGPGTHLDLAEFYYTCEDCNYVGPKRDEEEAASALFELGVIESE